MINKQIAETLSYRDILHHATEKNADGTPVRCRVNGVCKVWKTRPDEFRLPVKYSLKQCFYITPSNGNEWSFPNAG